MSGIRRGGDEVNYNAGLIDIAGTPCAEVIQAAREIGKTMYKTAGAGLRFRTSATTNR